MATSIGNLFIKLTADTSELQTRLKAAGQLMNEFSRQFSFNQLLTSGIGGIDAKLQALSGTLKGFASQIPYVGGAITGAVSAGEGFVDFLFKSTDAMAGNIKTADRLGLDYNTVAAAAKKAGIGIDEFGMKWQKVDTLLGQAAIGNQEAKGALARWGLSGIEDKSGDQAFRAVADRFQQLKDPMLQAAFLHDLVGKNALEMGKAMQDGAAGVDKMKEHIEQLTKAQQEQVKEAARQKKLADELGEDLKTKLTVGGAPVITATLKKASEDIRHPSLNTLADVGILSPVAFPYSAPFVGYDLEKRREAEIERAAGKEAQDKANEGLSEEQRRKERDRIASEALAASIKKVEDGLRGQAEAYKQGGAAIDIYRLKQQGATDAQLEGIKAIQLDMDRRKLTDQIVARLMAGAGVTEYNPPAALEFGSAAAISEINRMTAPVAGRDVQAQILEIIKQEQTDARTRTEYMRQVAEALKGVDLSTVTIR
jgi:hypothetical protein